MQAPMRRFCHCMRHARSAGVDNREQDVIMVGAGNAATCAALSAREQGASVLMIEVAPEDQRGGNSAFTGGAFRVVYHGGEDLARLIPDMNETELGDVDFGTYTEEQYFDDMGRLTQYRCDPDLTEILIGGKPGGGDLAGPQRGPLPPRP